MDGEGFSWNWDGNLSEDVEIFREMLFGDALEVYRRYGKERLKGVFLKRGHQADKRNRSFWMLVLGVEEGELEVNRDPERSFRAACKIWDY